jgi:hypothetical protein
MLKEEFLTKLSEVADWKIPDTPRETSLNNKRHRQRIEEDDQEHNEHDEESVQEAEPESGPNPTYPPMLLRLKIQPVDCDDCGRHCENGRQKEASLQKKDGVTYWRQRCITCKRHQDPTTGRFDISGQAALMKWHNFFRNPAKHYYKNRKEDLEHEQPIRQQITLETDESIIRIYQD